MKKFIVALLATLLFSSANACDFCNNLNGINPHYNENNNLKIHFLSQRSTFVSTGTVDEPYMLAKGGWPGSVNGILHHPGKAAGRESRKTIEVAYQHHMFDDWLFTTSIPFTISEVISTETNSSYGFGDVAILIECVLPLVQQDAKSITVVTGAGIKLPTAKNSFVASDGKRFDPHLQLGSGSTDLLLSAKLISQLGEWTFAFGGFGRMSTSNSYRDRVGNSLSLSLVASHDLYRKNSSLFAVIGSLGLRTELSARDKVGGSIDNDSGFANTYGIVGAQLVYSWFRFDVSVLAPMIQNRSAMFSQEKVRILGGIQFEF